jgi:hypothetical protein
MVHGSPPQIAQETRNLYIVSIVSKLVVDALERPLLVFSDKIVKEINGFSTIITLQLFLYQERHHEIKVDKFVFVILVFVDVLHLVARNLVLDLPSQLSTHLFGCARRFVVDRL